ncbi:hypothetical protein TNCV_3074411 [Trichonephila clavipes]|uniref:Uncharacterized protein n=1 Tax=Trichonephila clavipes TaxID=2585209 RepID=A0A8X6SGJ3_TRICX|nr:hypothetical protein TNCV_3074411 [Trichonephila clavipes]
MRDSSVMTNSFHSTNHIFLSSHQWRQRRLWFCVKGRPSNGRIVDKPLSCKQRRMACAACPHVMWCTEVDAIDHIGPSLPPLSNGHISALQLFGFVQHGYRFP